MALDDPFDTPSKECKSLTKRYTLVIVINVLFLLAALWFVYKDYVKTSILIKSEFSTLKIEMDNLFKQIDATPNRK